MVWSRIGDVCPNHPFHDQRQGVCPNCLREKLSDLSVSSFRQSSNTRAHLFPPSSFSSESSSPFNRLSPAGHRRRRRHHRHGSEVLTVGSMSFRLGVSGRTADALKKSHSIAFVSRNRPGGEAKNGAGKKCKKGFWSKLLHLKGKKEISMDMPESNVKEIKVNLGKGF